MTKQNQKPISTATLFTLVSMYLQLRTDQTDVCSLGRFCTIHYILHILG